MDVMDERRLPGCSIGVPYVVFGAKPTLCGRKRNDRFRDGNRGKMVYRGGCA